MGSALNQLVKDLGIEERVAEIAESGGTGLTASELAAQIHNPFAKEKAQAQTQTTVSKTAKTREDMQKKKEDALEEQNPVNSEEIKKERTEKEYEKYTQSEEYRENLEKKAEAEQPKGFLEIFASLSDPNRDLQQPKVIQDEKEQRMKAAKDKAEAEYNASEDQKVIVSDLEEISRMSDEERRILEQYAVNRDVDYFETVSSADQNGVKIGRAEEQAADLIAKYGQKRVDELANSLSRVKNEELTKKAVEAGQKHGNEHAVLSSAGTVGANLVGGISGTMDYFKELGRNDTRFKTLDPNAMGNLAGAYSGAVRGQVQKNIEGEDPNALRKLGSLAYQGVMSAADSAARAAVGGGTGGAILAGAGTFSQTMSEASARGATPGQAVALATASSAIEALSEKIPLDELVKTAQGGKQTAKQIIATALKQAGIEATTEEISLIGTMLADVAILKEKSSYKQDIINGIMRGLSPDQAAMEANRKVMEEAKNTALVSMLSGGMSSVTGSVAANRNAASTLNTEAKTDQKATSREELAKRYAGKEVQAEQAQTAPEQAETPATVAETATASEKETVQKPETQPQQQTAPQQEQKPAGVADIVADMVRKAQDTGNISNNDAAKILADPAAMAKLQQESGAEITGTNSEKRATVKDIVKQMVEKQNAANTTQEATQQPTAEAQQTVQTETAPQTQQAEQVGTEAQNAPEVRTQEADTHTGVQERASERVTESAEGGQQGITGKQNSPSGDIAQSKTFTNTGRKSADADIREAYKQTMKNDPNAADYEVKHNKDTLATAEERTKTVEQAKNEAEYLKQKAEWTAEDNVTAELVIKKMMQEGGEDAASVIVDMAAKRRDVNTKAGQVIQSNRIIGTMKAAASTETAVDSFLHSMNAMKPEQTTHNKKSGKDFETWKRDIETNVTEIGIAIESVEDGDSGSMRGIIRQIAKQRKTTAWFGTSDNLSPEANRILNKLDFDTLKKIANTQLASMADDYRKRSKKEVIASLRKQSMLSSLKTIARNIGGNAVGGIADAVSESGAGRLADLAMSKFTGKKTVGSDIFRAKEYATAAKDAGQFASLCVELNIPIETDAEASFDAATGKGGNEKYIGRTFRSTGNPAMRVLYAYQKYMSYSLEVTDKIFEGGTNAAVEASLNKLKNSNLTDEEVSALSGFSAQKRTFKNATWTDADGKTHGSELSRKAAKLQNATGVVGEVASPFVSTPMNVTQTGIDYTTGVVKGLTEMVSIIKDAKAGKTIPVERQRQAASDFGRGLTGTAMIGMFAAAAAVGALKVTNPEDWDKEALAKAEGRSGAQINWDALLRSMKGEEGKWKDGDVVSSVDFLEPFNTQMYLGHELAEFEKNADDETTWLEKATEYGKATVSSVWNSLMDSPVMTGLQEIADLMNDISEAETPEDTANAVAAYGGDIASSFIPQVVRQTAQHTDGYYRDTKGSTPAETALNSIKAAIPGLSQTLPKKYSGLGEEQKRGSWFETFVDPTATYTYKENEVTSYLDELSGRTGNDSIYPSRQAPVRIEVGGKTVELSPEQRETYQKTYGEKVNQLYSRMISLNDFNKLPDELKTEAFKEAEAYAKKAAMAAVSDYKEASRLSTPQLVAEVIADTFRSAINGELKDIDTARDYGYSTEESVSNMESFYKVFASLDKTTRANIQKDATGDTKKYLEVRQKGVTTKQYLAATERIDRLSDDSEIKVRAAISTLPGLSDSAKDTLMKAYMTDYKPNAKSPETTELKYDYVRKELGLSAKEYTDTYQAYLNYSKKSERIAAIQKLGYDYKTAKALYDVYAGNMKKVLIELYG